MKSIQRFAALALAILALSLLPAAAGPVIPSCTGACTFTSVALGGATIGTDALGVTGTSTFSSTFTITNGTFTHNGSVAVLAGGYFRADTVEGVTLANNRAYNLSSTTGSNGLPDVILARDKAGVLGLRDGTNAQTFRIWGTTSIANYLNTDVGATGNGDWLSFAKAAGGTATIATAKVGTGTEGNLILRGGAAGATLTLAAATTTATLSNGFILSAPGDDTALTDASLCRVVSTGAVVTGTAALGGCLGTSSARYKHDIKAMEDGLAQVLALKPVSFFYNKNYGPQGKEMYGLIAEDVVKVMPRLVGLDAQGRPNSVDMVGVIPVLVHALQEEHARVTALEARIAKLEKGQ